MLGVTLGVAGILVLISALLSAAEAAVFSVGRPRLRTLLEEGFNGAEVLSQVRDSGADIRAATVGLNLALNMAAVGLFTGVAVAEFGPLALAWALPGALVGTLLLTEAIPRLIAARRAIRLSLLTAPILLRVERLVRPGVAPFVRLDDLLQRRGNGEPPPSSDEREVRELAELGRREGVIDAEEHELLERAFRMDEMTAYDIMTPRVDIFAFKDALALEAIIPQLSNVPYSRVPVYGEGIDDITGILYVREAYEAYVSGRKDLPVSELSREPFFVPGSLPLPRLLRDFQARRLHMGIVADEFGGTDGLVTLEDVIEELVGEIEDERDVAEESFVRISKNEIVVEGGIELREVNYVFNVSLPHLEHRSLNGYLLEAFGHVPQVDERLELPGLEIEILEATETQVIRARLSRSQTALADEPKEAE